MSLHAIKWAMRQQCGASGAKLVLLMLAEATHDVPKTSHAGKTWPAWHAWTSTAHLEEVTELDRKTVLSNIKRLEGAGLIRQVGTEGRTNQVKVFRMPINDPENGTGTENGTGPESGTGTAFPGKGYRFSLQPVPKTGHGPVMTRKGNRSTRNGGADAPQAFDEFWPAYPRKVDKDDARKAFAKLNIDDILLKTMLAALAVHCRSDQWVKDAGKFVPYPSTWLNKKRWQDEGAGTGPDDSDHPAWALRAGFNNRYEAENDGCHEHNADAFSNGTRKEHA